MTDSDDVTSLQDRRTAPAFVGLSFALHVLQGRRRGQGEQFAEQWCTLYDALAVARSWVARGSLTEVSEAVRKEATSNVSWDLFDHKLAPYRGTTDGSARAWLMQVVRSHVVDLLRIAGPKTVSYDARKHDVVAAPLSTMPGYDREDDPDYGAGSLQDARRALGHLDLVSAEIARAHREGGDGLVRGMRFWLEGRGARTLDEQVAELLADEVFAISATRRMQLRTNVYNQRSRGRSEAIAAIARLASGGLVDDLVEASLYRLFRATLAERADLGDERCRAWAKLAG